MIRAVLTADIVSSTRLSQPAERRLMATIRSILKPHKHEFYRGDSFQVYIKEPREAMRIALLLRCAARRVESGPDTLFDVRIGIGLGIAKEPIKTLASARGEAFILSGRTFDEISKSDKRLMIVSGNTFLNPGLEILSEFTDELFEKITAKKAAVIFELLAGAKQTATAKKLKKSQSTINKHVQAARWSQIESILNKFDRFIKLLSS